MARLGELLVREHIVTEAQLLAAQAEDKRTAVGLPSALVATEALTETQLSEFFGRYYRVPIAALKDPTILTDAAKLIPEEVARKHKVVPLGRLGASLKVAMVDPSNIFAIDDIKFLTGLTIEVSVASPSAVQNALDVIYARGMAKGADSLESLMGDFADEGVAFELQESGSASIIDNAAAAQEAPVVRLVNLILLDAIKRGASDIHIEPYERSFRVRFRVDGALQETMRPPVHLKQAVVSRLKIMSSLDIAERRLPQDGRIKLRFDAGKEMDFRVSVLPTLFGEKVVMRLLDKGNLQLDMTKLGFEQKALSDFKSGIHKPFGIVLVTGPTGSGKTTTLYSALSELNTISENISTAEDPVEFNLAGINQVQMHDDIGLNFAAALRSFLRQDPDIIMVGEIRDYETCEIAIKAALTGHLVLSTLHTNDAPSTVSRMLNMGIEPFLITAALNVIIAQRLLRKLCVACKVAMETPPTDEALTELQVSPEARRTATFMRGAGCPTCNNSGYKGRIAIYEVMIANEAVKDAIIRAVPPAELKQVAIRNGLKTLRQAAITKLVAGETSMEEVSRVTATD